jgi:hypothetical protein
MGDNSWHLFDMAEAIQQQDIIREVMNGIEADE